MSVAPAAPALLAAFDATIDRVMRVARALPVVDPVHRGLAAHRRAMVEGMRERWRSVVRAIEPEVLAGDAAATARYDALVADAIDELRRARPAGRREAALAALDRAHYRDAPELLDDPSFPVDARQHVLATLDRLNENMGAYDRWVDLLEPVLAPRTDGSPVHVHDLASGHGGFALALKERLTGRVRVTASDISDDYLELGRVAAARRGLDVDFVPQDATRLETLGGPEVDVFVCTQSLHHFGPGMVARMLGEAARKARRAVVFVDGERGLVAALAVGAVMAAAGRAWPVLHDTVVSLRRMYVVEELLLLAHLAPGLPSGARVTAGRLPPGYAHVEVLLG